VRQVTELQASVQKFKEMVPQRPAGAFRGRGIVTIAGGFHYMTSAWISLHLLRRVSSLPVEMWFPVLELPTPQLEAELQSLGACAVYSSSSVVISLDIHVLSIMRDVPRPSQHRSSCSWVLAFHATCGGSSRAMNLHLRLLFMLLHEFGCNAATAAAPLMLS